MSLPRPKNSGPQRPYHHGDLKNALLGAARAMIERDGPAAISFREVSRSVGVGKSAPYNHFRDKEQLLAEVATIGFIELKDAQLAAIRSGAQPLDTLGRAYVDFARRNPQLYRLMFGGLISDWASHENAHTAKKLSLEPVKAAVSAELRARGEYTAASAETAVTSAWALVHGLAMLAIDGAFGVDHQPQKVEKLVARVLDWYGAHSSAK